MPKRIILATLCLAWFLPVAAATGQEGKAAACAATDGFQRLDFWLGEWDVYSGDRKVGENRIEKILSGCAVMEHWRGGGGGEGKSLFYFMPATATWRQVWVTGQATQPGGVKEKTRLADYAGEGVRFQGEIALPGGGAYLDRTTLTPLPEGRVRQVIEISRDGGGTWKATFDAVYVPRGGKPGE